jgi:hypothetical protein
MQFKREVEMGKSPVCEGERQQVGRWLTQLKSAGKLPGIIQFAANDLYFGPYSMLWAGKAVRRMLVRLFVENRWIVVASFHDEDVDKMPTLTIFDTHLTTVSYFPERRCLQIGNREFRMVDFTPELTSLVNQLAQGSAKV